MTVGDGPMSERTATTGASGSFQPDYEAAWRDLRERLISAAGALQGNAQHVGVGVGAAAERRRLTAKRDGVNLALSYMDDYERSTLAKAVSERG